MHNDIEKIIASEEEIISRVEILAKKITDEYRGRNPLILCVLKGSIVFTADLFRKIDCPAEIDFLQVASYGSGTKSGELTLKKDIDTDIQNRDVLVVEDILDSGRTLSHVIEMLKSRKPRSVKLCTLLDKPSGRDTEITADYVGMVVPDEFLVGYGLDYAEKYRNLPYVGVLKREVYEGK